MKKRLNKLSAIILIAIITALVSYVAYVKLNTVETSSSIAKIEAKVGEGTITLGSGSGMDISATNFTQAYTARPDTYCAGLHVALSRKIQQSATSPYVPDGGYSSGKQMNTYQLVKSTPTPQTMAYARWQGATGEAMQKIIWSSYQWKGYGANALIVEDHTYSLSSDSDDIGGRAQQFANFVYIGLGNNDTLGMSCTPATDGEAEGSIKIVVNQSDMTYTAGPYTLNIAHQGESLLEGGNNIANLVWEEIVNNKTGKFCWGSIDATISFQNGSSKNSYIDVLDANGNQIQGNFPRFGEIFYIRYHTSDSEDIVEKMKPNIKIDYMTKITGTTYSYKSTRADYKLMEDNAGVLRNAMQNIVTGKGHRFSKSGDMNKQQYNLYGGYGSISVNMFGANSWYIRGSSEFDGFLEDLQDSLGTKLQQDAEAQWGKVSKVFVSARYTPCAVYKDIFYPDAGVSVDYYESRREVIPHHHREYEYVDRYGNYGWQTSSNPPFGGYMTGSYRDVHDWDEIIRYYKGRAYLNGMHIGTTGEYRENTEGALSAARSIISAHVSYGIQIDDIAIFELNENMQPVLTMSGVTLGANRSESATLGGKEINMFIAGNVWEDMPSMKLGEYTGHRDGNSLSMAGIQVELWDNNRGTLVGRTMTNAQGNYGFQKINPMHKYYVVFTYDGMRYESTIYNNNLSGGYSTGAESILSSGNRSNFNDLFDTIDTTPHSYYKGGTWRKAYRSVHQDRK